MIGTRTPALRPAPVPRRTPPVPTEPLPHSPAPQPGRPDWDWASVRRDLVAAVTEVTRPSALAVRAALIECDARAVGAEQVTDPRTGRQMTGQRVVGLSLVTARGSVPVDWRLMLTPRWFEPGLRERAGIPDDAPTGGSVTQGIDMALGLGLGRHVPVLLDARRAHVPGVLRALRSGRLPYVLRVSGAQFVNPGAARHQDPHGHGFVTARQAAAEAERHGGSVLTLTGREPAGPVREIVRLDCHALAVPGVRKGRMVLLAERDPRNPARGLYWLTDLTGHSTAQLLRLVRLPEPEPRLPAGYSGPAPAGDGVSSYDDWHRRATLASVAHASALLAARPGTGRPTGGRTTRVA
ncbi:hypothetical protein C3489_01615 [Streptomyces sp. Ru71]|uniref:transposase n=1 Tax=Streptomyces sp. Ru71 TaxID=2080746 RepID=UPI000CDE1177|nr:transposase [Streptomyces sp. Ru71]POX56979.1 hypothetical protein C3489_01615 [Streptomyces sp. Ru71]